MAAASERWLAQNQQALLARIATVRTALRRHRLARSEQQDAEMAGEIEQMQSDAEPASDGAAPIDVLAARLGLTDFECGILVLCAGVELDSEVAAECAAHGGGLAAATFALALAALPSPCWSALAPTAPLRRYGLIELAPAGPAGGLTKAPLHLPERMLHHLIGLAYLEPQLSGLLDELGPPPELCPSLHALAERLVRWLRDEHGAAQPSHILHLLGEDRDAQLEVAAAAAAAVGLVPLRLTARELPADPSERSAITRWCLRECVLMGALLVISCDSGLSEAQRHAAAALAAGMDGPVVIAGAQTPLPTLERTLRLRVPQPSLDEQRHLWLSALGPLAAACQPGLEPMLSHFRLGPTAIRDVALATRAAAAELPVPPAQLVWQACREHARGRLDELASRIESSAGWDDLILPGAQLDTLRAMAGQLCQRLLVYEGWGFGRAGRRGLGITALFAGTSGTGKTLAAEVLANQLQLDLYRIDLSQVVSKYIGETEKNLGRVFDAAEQAGAVLLFDEADALFGKRTEVSDSHDRYANIEVSYLLQRMEAYRGLAILTSNLKGSIDSAFLRRIRFVVQFPFPDRVQRQELWRRAIHPDAPTEGLDLARLGQLSVAGGNIRNIALNAAFLAADAGEPLRMQHLLRAARSEYTKLEKTLTDAEVQGWL